MFEMFVIKNKNYTLSKYYKLVFKRDDKLQLFIVAVLISDSNV